MKTSEFIKDIASALSKAQAAMTGAKKDSSNPFFKSKYSDLSSVMEAISKPFADNELSFIQSPSFADDLVTVTTRIMHSSGQWIEGTVALPPTKNDAQGYGSAITYGKRYGLQAMAGVPSVDDDANAAVKGNQPAKKKMPSKDEITKTRYAAAHAKALQNMDEETWQTKVEEAKHTTTNREEIVKILEEFAGVN